LLCNKSYNHVAIEGKKLVSFDATLIRYNLNLISLSNNNTLIGTRFADLLIALSVAQNCYCKLLNILPIWIITFKLLTYQCVFAFFRRLGICKFYIFLGF